MNKLFLYSVNTLMANIIAKHYYYDRHYVWVAPYFADKEGYNPPSSNPKDIYSRLVDDIKKKDKHSSKISENKAGILKGALAKLESGVINQEQFDEINDMIKLAETDDFSPLIYIIDSKSVSNVLKKVPVKMKAHVFSQEFLIEDLSVNQFEIIQL